MTARVRTIGVSCLAALGAVSTPGCGSANDAPAATTAKKPPQPTRIVLTGQGIVGARIGAPAVAVQALVTRVLGAPDDQSFSGCRIFGPNARYGERTWRWGALSLVFENRATTAKVVPGRFTAWMVVGNGKLDQAVELPHGITRRSTMQDVRSATALSRAGNGLPGYYALAGTDGVEYTFNKDARRLEMISLHAPGCE